MTPQRVWVFVVSPLGRAGIWFETGPLPAELVHMDHLVSFYCDITPPPPPPPEFKSSKMTKGPTFFWSKDPHKIGLKQCIIKLYIYVYYLTRAHK